MASTDWKISGVELSSCNCNWGCPCQFNAMPTSGQCEAVWAMRIDSGHFGSTRLDTLTWGFLVWWPGAVHQGNGKMQVFGDERATPEQRKALLAVAAGKVSSEGTYFQIFSAMAPEFLAPVWAPTSFSWDLDKRSATLEVGSLVSCKVEPIRNPITGDEHRARVVLPNGFEYKEAEYASGTFSSTGPIALKHQGTHAHLARVGFNAAGCV